MITDKKEDLYSIVNLTDLDGNKAELNDNTIYLTDKLAQLLDVNEGDTVTLENTDGELVEIKVGKNCKKLCLSLCIYVKRFI